MAIQPINYAQQAGLGGFETGFNQAQGIADAFNKQQMLGQQQELMDKQAEESRNLQAQFESAYKSGDIDALNVLGIQNPEVSDRLLSAIEKQSGAKKDEVTALAEQITYNPDSAEKLLTDRIQVIQARGGDPSNTVQMLKEFRDPKTRQNFLDETRATFAMTASPERFKKYREFSGASDVEPMTEYQSEMVRQKETEMNIRKLEIEEKRLERKLKRETDVLKKKELEQKISENSNKAEAAKKSRNADAIAGYQAGKDTLDLINRIKTHDGFSSYIGAKGASSLFGIKDEPFAGTDAAAVAGMIDTLSSQNFLNAVKQMSGMGALSDAEGKKLSSAITSLNPSMPEGDFIKNLELIETLTKRGMEKYKNMSTDSSIFEEEQEVSVSNNKIQAPVAAVQALSSNPALRDQFKAKYGYLPEGY